MTGLEFLILALGAYRVWQLLAEDDLTKPLRKRVGVKWLGFVTCPWCLGFWVCLAWALAFWADHRAVWVAVPFALSTVVAFAYAALSRLDEYEENLPG